MKKILLLLICSQIIAQETLNETIVFESRNPFSFEEVITNLDNQETQTCLLYTSPSPRDQRGSRMPSSA